MIERLRKLLGRGSSNENNKHLNYPRHEKPDAIILAAGMMGKKTLFPKALFEYGGKAIILHQISWLKPFVRKIIIACHKKEHESIANYLGATEGIEFSLEENLLGTAGAIKKALSKTKTNNIIIVNVDDMTDIDLNALIDFGPDTICIANPRLNFGLIETEGFDITQFREKPLIKDLWASCGVYLMSRKTLEKLPESGSLEQDVWPYTTLKAFKHFGIWKAF
jgi:D-glycero-alpha-D-manno-heptose 1-phosphate guanylyltransferase